MSSNPCRRWRCRVESSSILSSTGSSRQISRLALEAAQAFRPDVVLLDIGMPKLNGYEVCRHIRQQAWGKGMTLFALTGWGQEEDQRRSLEAGFDAHLVKPVLPATLENLLVSGLHSSQSRVEATVAIKNQGARDD